MTSEINPLRPNSTPMLNAGAAGAEGLRNQYNQRGGKNGGGKDKDEKEKEEAAAEPLEDEEEQGYLDADSFSGRKSRAVIDNLFSESLPWEREEEDRTAKLEELKRKREDLARRGGPAPAPRQVPGQPQGQAARKPGGTGPLSPPRSGSGPLANLKVPPPPADAGSGASLSAPLGRRVDENFDPTAALNNTLLAQQALRDRQLQRELAENARKAPDGEPADVPGLAQLLRPSAPVRSPSGRLPALPDDGGMLTAPTRPDIEMAPMADAKNAAIDAARRSVAPPSVRLPSVDELAGTAAPRTPRAPTGKLAPRPPGHARPNTGKLDAAAAAGQARAAAPRSPEGSRTQSARPGPAALAGGHVEPRAEHRPPPASAQPAEPRAPIAPSWTTAQPPAVAPAPPTSAPEVVPPAPGAGEAAPTRRADGAAPPGVKAGKVSAACVYRIIDVASDKPLGGARIELEPTRDDLLPNIHGQADANGWYGTEGLPPGEYRVTVRAPGYVPAFKVRQLEAGVIDDLAIFIAKP